MIGAKRIAWAIMFLVLHMLKVDPDPEPAEVFRHKIVFLWGYQVDAFVDRETHR